MDKLLKDANDGTAQAEFVCIDSCNDKEGCEYRLNQLVSPGVFTPTPKTPRTYASPLAPMMGDKPIDGVRRRLVEVMRLESLKKDKVESKATEPRTSKPLTKVAMLFNVLFVLTAAGVMLFAGFTVYNALKKSNGPTHLDMDKFKDQAEVDIFFEKDPAQSEQVPKYKFLDSVKKRYKMGAWRVQEIIELPIGNLKYKVYCGAPLQPRFATTKHDTIKHNAYCRWIIRDWSSVIRECALVQKEGPQEYAELFGDPSFCRLDFDLPAKNPTKSPTDVMVPPRPISHEQGPFARFRRAGKLVSEGILYVLRRMGRSTKITYHRAVVTLKELLNLAEPRVKFLGGAAHSFAHQKIWPSLKGGYNQLSKRLLSLLRLVR